MQVDSGSKQWDEKKGLIYIILTGESLQWILLWKKDGVTDFRVQEMKYL